MLTSQQLAALDAAAAAAVACEAATGLPAGVSVAQWALESGWGHYSPGNNCFGIKFYPGAAGSQWLATHEYVHGKPQEQNLLFATFPTLEACFEKHAQLLTTAAPYRAAWAKYCISQDVEQFVKDMAAVYATDPRYAETVLSVMQMAAVQAAVMPSIPQL